MRDLPHHYRATAHGGSEPDVLLESPGVSTLRSDTPSEFGGPGDRWSPETLLVAAVADCFVLTFRAVASASKLPWTTVTCEVEGTLDRVDRAIQFTHLAIDARLTITDPADEERARRALVKAESNCLITNSLKATVDFRAEVSAPALAGV